MAVSSQYPALGSVRFYFLYAKWLFKTHLTPSYRLFSILDVTPIYRIGAPPLVADKSATVNGRSVSSFPACPFLGCDRRGSANSKGNRSSPLYAICPNWITFLQFVGFDSNYSFTDVTVKSNRTGNIPRQGSGLSCRLSQPEAGSLTRFTASIIKHLMLHWKGDRTRQFSVGVFGVPLHLLARFYFSYPKFHHTTRAEYLPHNLWRPICFSI